MDILLPRVIKVFKCLKGLNLDKNLKKRYYVFTQRYHVVTSTPVDTFVLSTRLLQEVRKAHSSILALGLNISISAKSADYLIVPS